MLTLVLLVVMAALVSARPNWNSGRSWNHFRRHYPHRSGGYWGGFGYNDYYGGFNQGFGGGFDQGFGGGFDQRFGGDFDDFDQGFGGDTGGFDQGFGGDIGGFDQGFEGDIGGFDVFK
ncbi:protein suex-1-like [Cherax quadricarinatus]|uniref:protein suex-1-like n=1 Tax=Cherax quadricarinatus TaxID=27406 RepID=UPI002379A7AE|nr:neuropeptide-like protein 29 [Cherax quadricarinatus]